ncbi:MAG: SH3 domain-containing protein, partial [Oscillospiraceae bacterium]|nr:SH3 domain-containing protein [Oscillospiraceae bacterium]
SSDLNVRERPSTDSAILGTLPKGTSVSVYNIDGYSDWYKVYCSQYNLSGYVSAQYVKETKGMTYDTSAAGSDFSFFNEPYSRKVITESDPLNLRSAPSTSAEIIIKMPKGSLVKLYGSDGGGLIGGLDNSSEWSYISYTENGITYYGYASSEFIGLP